jgi:ribonuclease HII
MDHHVIGIDEVGWGCIAGPLVVCACSVPFGNWDILREKGFRDSKLVGNRIKVGKTQRPTRYTDGKCTHLAEWLSAPEQQGLATWALCQVEVGTLNTNRNPLDVKDEAFRRALLMLMTANKWDASQVDVIIDGERRIPTIPSNIHQEAFTEADKEFLPASVASVIAKSYRDKQMVLLGTQYPGYGFDQHKGYGTEAHVQALLKYGMIKDTYRLAFTRSRIITHWKKLTDRDKSRAPLPQWAKELCGL